MKSLRVERVAKEFGSVRAVDNVSLDVRAGEFLTLLGPSGSGKTTLLMMVAGLTMPSSGEIWIGDENATSKPPYERDIGMVFQNYALFPHMTVADNVAFPLRMRRVRPSEIARRVVAALETVRLPQMGDRFPRQLSGGQQQRVALARALVFNPSVLLMDEPLGALDKKLREHVQFELKQLHTSLNITVLYVTHDQDEALTMSDRICLMRDGRIEQLGTPHELYRQPRTHFAADFLGESNFLPVNGSLIMVRPEAVAFAGDGNPGTIEQVVFMGGVTRYIVKLESGQDVIVKHLNHSTAERRAVGDRVTLRWESADSVVL